MTLYKPYFLLALCFLVACAPESGFSASTTQDAFEVSGHHIIYLIDGTISGPISEDHRGALWPRLDQLDDLASLNNMDVLSPYLSRIVWEENSELHFFYQLLRSNFAGMPKVKVGYAHGSDLFIRAYTPQQRINEILRRINAWISQMGLGSDFDPDDLHITFIGYSRGALEAIELANILSHPSSMNNPAGKGIASANLNLMLIEPVGFVRTDDPANLISGQLKVLNMLPNILDSFSRRRGSQDNLKRLLERVSPALQAGIGNLVDKSTLSEIERATVNGFWAMGNNFGNLGFNSSPTIIADRVTLDPEIAARTTLIEGSDAADDQAFKPLAFSPSPKRIEKASVYPDIVSNHLDVGAINISPQRVSRLFELLAELRISDSQVVNTILKQVSTAMADASAPTSGEPWLGELACTLYPDLLRSDYGLDIRDEQLAKHCPPSRTPGQ